MKGAHFRAGDHFMAVPNFILVALHLALRRHANNATHNNATRFSRSSFGTPRQPRIISHAITASAGNTPVHSALESGMVKPIRTRLISPRRSPRVCHGWVGGWVVTPWRFGGVFALIFQAKSRARLLFARGELRSADARFTYFTHHDLGGAGGGAAAFWAASCQSIHCQFRRQNDGGLWRGEGGGHGFAHASSAGCVGETGRGGGDCAGGGAGAL